MHFDKIKPLERAFSAEVGLLDDQSWHCVFEPFADANIYQTWAYGKVLSGRRSLQHLIVRKESKIVAVAQARIVKVPLLPAGIAYVFWGPLWRRDAPDADNVFRQVLRALRNEFVCKQGLTLRMFPRLRENDNSFAAILAEENFPSLAERSSSQTIVMDLSPPLSDLRDGMKGHFQRELKIAERNELEVEDGTSEELFDSFIQVYREMVSRKRFVEPNDINQFKQVQRLLPQNLKMRIMLCKSDGQIVSGAIYSAIGKTAIYLFGATSSAGLKSRGSYLLQWKLIEALKEKGVEAYDLNGINPAVNPGTFKFKSDLAGRNGRESCYLGRFESTGNALSYLFVHGGETARRHWHTAKSAVQAKRVAKLKTGIAR